MIHLDIYKKLKQLGVIDLLLNNKDYAKAEVSGYMPLSFDKVYENKTIIIIALAHNYKQNGDVMADPDMQIAIHKFAQAEALSFQQDNIGLYQQVYDTFPSPRQVKPSLKRDLNIFLNNWLSNCINQGFQFKAAD